MTSGSARTDFAGGGVGEGRGDGRGDGRWGWKALFVGSPAKKFFFGRTELP